MSFIEIYQFPCRSDNYGVLIKDKMSNIVILIDAPEESAILAAITHTGWVPTHLLITHHHHDHTEAAEILKTRYSLNIIAPAHKKNHIDGIDQIIESGEGFRLGTIDIDAIGTPGHTLDHIAYSLPEAKIVFTGDSLFALGCGRLFEGNAEMMWASLQRLSALPEETQVYCGHEYTEANARFALTIDSDNPALQAYAQTVFKNRKNDFATLPTTIGAEKAANPFLRANELNIKTALNMTNASDIDVFAEIRRRKDHF